MVFPSIIKKLVFDKLLNKETLLKLWYCHKTSEHTLNFFRPSFPLIYKMRNTIFHALYNHSHGKPW